MMAVSCRQLLAGQEVDVVVDTGKKLIPIEIKAGETVVGSLFGGLRYFVALGAPVFSPPHRSLFTVLKFD